MRPGDTYASYLLRLWQVQNNTWPTWVASIRVPATGEERHFPSVEALAAFLLHEFRVGEGADSGAAPDGAEDGRPDG